VGIDEAPLAHAAAAAGRRHGRRWRRPAEGYAGGRWLPRLDLHAGCRRGHGNGEEIGAAAGRRRNREAEIGGRGRGQAGGMRLEEREVGEGGGKNSDAEE
jgi:hypothetical protein